MPKQLWIWVAVFLSLASVSRADVLIVADEFPAMEVLAKHLMAEDRITSQLVDQAHLPPALGGFSAVVVYIHKELQPPPERAFIDYAQNGGRLVLLHHSISSGKRQNRDWFGFLGVALPEGSPEQGGYKWIEKVSITCVNLAPEQYVTSHAVSYPAKIAYPIAGRPPGASPAFTLEDTEVYLNHVLHGAHTLFLGFHYTDAKTGKVWDQQTAGWSRPAGRGMVFYFMPGHSAHDFENPTYSRIVLNAITAKAQ